MRKKKKSELGFTTSYNVKDTLCYDQTLWYKTITLHSCSDVYSIWAPQNSDLIRIYIFQITRDKLLESGI